MESAVVAFAAFWSFEVCVYTLPPYLGLILYESIRRDKVLKVDWGSLKKRMIVLMGFCLLFLCFIYADVYRRTNEWPHWSYYFDYISLYKNGFWNVFHAGTGRVVADYGYSFDFFINRLGQFNKMENRSIIKSF